MDVNQLPFIDRLNVNDKKLVILIVVRDIREVITSKHPICDEEYFIGHDYSCWPTSSDFSTWNQEGTGVTGVNKQIQKVKGREDVTIIKYEDLVSRPDGIQKELQKKYGLLFEASFSDYHNRSDKLAYKYEGRYRANNQELVLEGKKITEKQLRWKSEEHDNRIYEQFTQCPSLFDALKEFGYEENDDWFDYYIEKFS